MDFKTSTRIEPGEMTERDGKVYLAETWQHDKPCLCQCDMARGERCNGFCFRWDNAAEVVFRFLLPVGMAGKATIVRTPDLITKKVEVKLNAECVASRKRFKEKEKKAKSEAEKRERGTGSLYQFRDGWRGDIYLDRQRYTFTHAEKEEVEKWLDYMNGQRQAFNELERLKKK